MKFVIIVMLFSSFSVQAAPTCSAIFGTTQTKTLRPSYKPDYNRFIRAVAQVISETKRIPQTAELADKLNISQVQIDSYLAKKSTPNLLSAIAVAKQQHPDIFRDLEREYAAAAAKILVKTKAIPSQEDVANELGVTAKDIRAIYAGNKDVMTRVREYEPEAYEMVLGVLINAYVKTARHYGRSPTMEEVLEFNPKLKIETIESMVGKGKIVKEFDDLFQIAAEKKQSELAKAVDLKLFNEARFKKLMQDLRDGETIVITDGIVGDAFNRDFIGAIDTFNKTNKGSLFVIPGNMVTTGLDKIVHERDDIHVLVSEVELSEDLKISNIQVTPKQINSLQGLDRVGKRGQQVIVGAPKMVMNIVPTADNRNRPHGVWSTGSINNKDIYMKADQKLIQLRTSYIAENDHRMGAIIIEKASQGDSLVDLPRLGKFHIRHVEYIPEKKGFMDLNRFYTPSGVQQVRAEAVSFGDIHVGFTDQRLLTTVAGQIFSKLKPLKIFLHDLFDGASISHHEKDRIITVAQKAESGKLNLEQELEHVRDFLLAMESVAPGDAAIYVVGSNHNEWLPRWINSGRYNFEPQNTKIGLELALAMSKGREPLEYFLERRLPHSVFRKLIFLKSNEDVYVGPKERRVLMSKHGDKGANGARGSKNSFQKGADGIAVGHGHGAYRQNDTIMQGTFTRIGESYDAGGLSNWIFGLTVIGPNGEKQFLTLLPNNEWYRDREKPVSPPEQFYAPGYPKAKPNNEKNGSRVIDQYSP